MAQKTQIEWTNATWNPVTGCTKISAGCDNCYAERFSERFRGVKDHPFENGFDLTLKPERIAQPLSWKKPQMIFVNSMSDLFHKEVPDDYIAQVFDTMEKADWHVFQLLTKRSSLMKKFIGAFCVSGFITSEVGLLLFGVGFMLPEGIFQKIAYVLAGIGTLVFFTGFLLHAYKVELELMDEADKVLDEE